MFIDIEQHTVETCDSYYTVKRISEFSIDSDDDSDVKEDIDTNKIVLMRKWIVKSMSIIDYLVNKRDNEKELSFNSEDMCVRDTFDGFDLSW